MQIKHTLQIVHYLHLKLINHSKYLKSICISFTNLIKYFPNKFCFAYERQDLITSKL